MARSIGGGNGWESPKSDHFPSSPARRVAAPTASISAERRPWRSSSARPAMVVPPGEVTMSLSTAGCSPVSKHHRGGSEHGLRGEAHGIRPRDAGPHAAVGQRVDDHINVSRTAAGEPGDRVHQSLGHLDRQADRAEQRLRGGGVRGIRAGPEAISGGSVADESGSIRHGADDPEILRSRRFQRGERDAGRDGNHQPRPAGGGFRPRPPRRRRHPAAWCRAGSPRWRRPRRRCRRSPWLPSISRNASRDFSIGITADHIRRARPLRRGSRPESMPCPFSHIR